MAITKISKWRVFDVLWLRRSGIKLLSLVIFLSILQYVVNVRIHFRIGSTLIFGLRSCFWKSFWFSLLIKQYSVAAAQLCNTPAELPESAHQYHVSVGTAHCSPAAHPVCPLPDEIISWCFIQALNLWTGRRPGSFLPVSLVKFYEFMLK